MDELDRIVTEERARFDEEPMEGHFERFANKLEKQRQHNRRNRFNPIFFKVAAVLVIALLVTDIFFKVNQQTNQPAQQAQLQPQNEIGEAALYYNTRINSGLQQLEQMASQGIGSENEIVQVKIEMAEMDSLFTYLKQEYEANPNDERIINAMIDYYQTKLNIVNTIKSELENVKQQKMKYNENVQL